ncbi:MAG TPA: nuclear transport factor 2 family protein [Polyangia bacterium]|jgi:hypothetical protein
MNNHQNLETVKQLYAALGAGDLKSALDVIDGGVDWSVPGGAPWSGEGRGHAHVSRFFEALGTTANLKVFEPRRFVAEGDQVVVIGYEEGEVRKTGTAWKAHFTHVFTIANGKITQHREYVDTQAISEALRA